MQTKSRSQGDKWLGLIMIAVAVIIALLGVTTTSGRFYGRMHDGSWELRRHGGYGGHMMASPGSHAMGRASIGQQWMGNGFMGPSGMMSDAHTSVWFDFGYDLDLSDQQNDRIETILEQARDVQWDLSRRVRDEQWQLMKLVSADSPDPAQVGKQYAGVSELSRQILENSIDARRRIDALLTQEQRDDLRSRRQARIMNWGGF